MKRKSTKKPKSELNDWARSEYKRSDLDEMVRGKYAERLNGAVSLVLLDPEVAKVFPTSEAVNEALRSLILKKSRSSKVVERTKGKKQPIGKKSRAA